MDTESLSLQQLTLRIAQTPAEFLLPPRIGTEGTLVVPAVVHDLLEMHGAGPTEFDAESWVFAADQRNIASITAVLCWLLAEPELLAQQLIAPGSLQQQLHELPRELDPYCSAHSLVEDADRREELARLALARLGLRPAGESLAQAQDRLSTLSSAERARVIAASRAAEQRAREVRAALARKAAEESADKWGRE